MSGKRDTEINKTDIVPDLVRDYCLIRSTKKMLSTMNNIIPLRSVGNF